MEFTYRFTILFFLFIYYSHSESHGAVLDRSYLPSPDRGVGGIDVGGTSGAVVGGTSDEILNEDGGLDSSNVSSSELILEMGGGDSFIPKIPVRETGNILEERNNVRTDFLRRPIREEKSRFHPIMRKWEEFQHERPSIFYRDDGVWGGSLDPKYEMIKSERRPTRPRQLSNEVEFTAVKRSPACLRKCMAQGFLHPAQCHSLC